MPFPEQRASDSAPVVLRIKLRYETVDSFVERLAIYINRDGMFLRSPAPKPVGTPLIIELRLANGTLVLECEGVVRWIRGTNPEQPAFSQGMGVEFKDLAPESEEIIALIEATRARRGWNELRGIPGAPPEQLDGESSPAVPATARQGSPATARQGSPATARQGSPATARQGRRHVTVDELMARARSAAAPDAPEAHASELDALMAGDASAVVSRALTRARELASHADDQELEALLAASPEPGAASTADASSWLAAHLGGSAIAPRPRAASRPAAKPVARPAEKPGDTMAAKPVERPAAKPGETMAAKPMARPAEKPVATTAAKPAEKPVATTAKQPSDRPARRPSPATAAPVPARAMPPAARGPLSPRAPRPGPVTAPAPELASRAPTAAVEERPARALAAQPVHAPEVHEDAGLAMDLTGDPVSYPSIEIVDANAQTAHSTEDAPADRPGADRGNFPATEIHAASLPAADDEDDLMVTIELDGDNALDSLLGLAPGPRGRGRRGGVSVDEESTVVRDEPAFGPDSLFDAGGDEATFVFEEPSAPEDLLPTPDSSGAAEPVEAAPEQPAPPSSLNLLLDDDFGPEFDFPPDADASGFFDHLHHDSGPVLFRQNQAETQFADVPTLAIEIRHLRTDSEDEVDSALGRDDIDALVDSLDFNAGALDADELRASDPAERSSEGVAAAAMPASGLDADHTVAEVVDNLDEIEALEIDPDMLEPADEDDMEIMMATAAAPPPLPPGATRPPPVPPAPRVAGQDDEQGDDDDDPSRKRGFFSRIFNK